MSAFRNRLRKRWLEGVSYVKDSLDPPGYVYNGKQMSKLFDEEQEHNTDEYKQKVDAHFRAQRRRVREVVFNFNPLEDMPLTSMVAKEVLKEAVVEPGFRVLDYSPSMGSVGLPAAQLCPFAHFDIVDDSWEIIEQYQMFAKSAKINNCDFYLMDTEVPVQRDSYDLVFSNFGLVQSDDIRRDLRDIWRVLKPGCKLIFSCWSTFEETSALNLLDAMLQEMYPDRFTMRESGQWHISELQAIFYDIDDYNLIDVREIEKTVNLERGADYWELMMNPARKRDLARLFTEDEIDTIRNYVATFLDSQYLFESVKLYATANVVIARKPANTLERLMFD